MTFDSNIFQNMYAFDKKKSFQKYEKNIEKLLIDPLRFQLVCLNQIVIIQIHYPTVMSLIPEVEGF